MARFLRTTRLTLLVGLLLVGAVLAWLAAHPQIYAGHVGRLVARNLLQDTGISFRSSNFTGDLFSGVQFESVSVTRRADDGTFFYLTADSLRLRYELSKIMRRDWRLRELRLFGAEVLLRLPATESEEKDSFELPRDLAVDALGIHTLDARVETFGGGILEEIENASLLAQISPHDIGLEVRVDSLAGNWVSRDLPLHSTTGRLQIGGGRLRLDPVVIHVRNTRASIRGFFDAPNSFALNCATSHFEMEDLLRGLGNQGESALELAGQALVRMDEGRIRINSENLSGEIEGYPLQTSKAEISIEDQTLVFETLEGRFLDTEFRVNRGGMDFEESTLDLQGVVTGADLSRPWTGEPTDWPSSDLSGPFELSMDFTGQPTLDLSVQALEGRFGDFPADSLSGQLLVREDGSVRFEKFRGRIYGSRLRASGGISAAGQIDMDIAAVSGPLSPWINYLGWEGVQAQGLRGSGKIIGDALDPQLRVTGSVDTLSAFGRAGMRDAEFSLEAPLLRAHLDLKMEATSPEFRLAGESLGALQASLQQQGTRTLLPKLRLSSGDTLFSTEGWISGGQGDIWQMQVDSLQWRAGTELWEMVGDSRIEFSEAHARTEGLELNSQQGRFNLRGGLLEDGRLDLSLEVSEGELGFLPRSGLIQSALRGKVGGAIRLGGRPENPTGTAHLRLNDVAFAGQTVDSLSLHLNLAGSVLEVDSLRVASPSGRLASSGKIFLPRRDWIRHLWADPSRVGILWELSRLDLHASAAGVLPERLLPPEAAEAATGEISFSGTLQELARAPRVSGQARWDALEAGPFLLPSLSATVEADSNGLRLREGQLHAPDPWIPFQASFPLVLSVAGPSRWDPQGGVSIELGDDEETDLAPLSRIWPDLRLAEGTGRLRLRATGDPRSPNWEGGLQVDDGRLAMARLSEELREIRLRTRFKAGEPVLLVEELTAREGLHGQVSAVGEVRFKELLPDDIWLDLKGERILLASVPELRAIASSDDLQLRLVRPVPGGVRMPRLSGSAVVDKALYTGDFKSAAAGPVAPPPLLISMRLRLRDQVRISNQSAELRVVGDVDYEQDLAGIRLRGEAEIPQGRVPVFSNDFTITDGRIDFSRGRGTEPWVDITAETEVPVRDPAGTPGRELELVRVFLSGTFSAPTLRFESESGYDENTILRLLAGFSPGQDTALGSGLGNVGFKAGLNFLERALAQQVGGIDTIDIETEEAGIEEVDGTRVAVGKYLGENLYLRYSQGLSITERDLFLEYQISRRLLFTSELRRRIEEAGAQTGFNLDLKFRVKY